MVLDIFKRILLSLLEIYRRQILHENLKFENVMIDFSDEIRVTDFLYVHPDDNL